MSESLILVIAFFFFFPFQSFFIKTQVPAGLISIYQAADPGGSSGTNTGSGQFSNCDWK